MWPPLLEIEAIPSQLLFPYFALQTSTLPNTAPHFRDIAPGVIIDVLS